MMLEELCRRPLQTCFGLRNGGEPDELLWGTGKLKAHAFGEYSVAVVQANSLLEDQAQVLATPSATFVGVFDGHGGPTAARFVNAHLFPLLERQGALSSDALRKAFDRTEQDFLQLVRKKWPTEPQIAMSGSCCLVGAISNGTLYVANLGDSRAVLGRRVSGGGALSLPSVMAERLTSDHNVGIKEVRQEVQALHPDDKRIVMYIRGFWRIKGIIQVSRSIGDVYLKSTEFNTLYQKFGSSIPLKRAVITAEPSISSRKLNPDDLFVIFASDGFWEHLSDKAAVEMVYKSPRFGISKRLARAAVQEAARKCGIDYEDLKKLDRGIRRHFHDDITVVVVYLDSLNNIPKDASQEDNVYVSTITPTDILSYNAEEAEADCDSFT